VGAAVAAGGAAVLYFFAPEQHAFYPRCWLYVWTGWQCPGCGGLRAAHELLHGHWAAAWQQNALLLVLLPVLAAWAAGEVVWRLTGRESWRCFRRPVWVWAVVGALVVFGLLRNVPWARLAGLGG
jgi:hypothetical protein